MRPVACVRRVLRRGSSRSRWCGAAGGSALLHAAALAALSCFAAMPPSTSEKGLDVAFNESMSPEPVSSLESPTILIERRDGEPRGGHAPAPRPEPSLRRLAVRAPGGGVSLLDSIGRAGPQGLGEVVGPLDSDEPDGQGEGTGHGTGKGSGNGTGMGGGFFGVKPAGRSVVYVVDCSRSMNHPHASEVKTRFRRLKLELANSISAMDAEREFFVIFFNVDAIPMPAAHLQAATRANKQQCLAWLAEMRAERETDPRSALTLALRMRPDVIHFLTDGSFERPIERELLRLSQTRTAIHTFAFGDQAGRETLKAIAKANGGKFHFVP